MRGRGGQMGPKALMILATGKQTVEAVSTKGFSLIEIVLVLGLMAFAAAVVITNFASLADRGDSQTSEEILQAAVREARFVAASERIITELRFDKENGSLSISSDAGVGETFALNESFSKDGPAEISFLPSATLRGLGTANRCQSHTPQNQCRQIRPRSQLQSVRSRHR